MLPDLTSAETSVRATELAVGDRVAFWKPVWEVGSVALLGPRLLGHEDVQGVIQRMTPSTMWIDTGDQIIRCSIRTALAGGAWRSRRATDPPSAT
jgi:hypothetical protein